MAEQLWKGRFSKAVDSRVNDFNSSIRFDQRMIAQDMRGSGVHAAMLARQGIISEQDCADILSGLVSALFFGTNLLGLGTLATMSGLQAISKLKEKNYPLQIKILVVINTAGFSILPTTMMTIRQNYHSQNILAFYPYSLFIGFSITIIGIVIIKVIEHV